jgi:predicted double-glycine peptidase
MNPWVETIGVTGLAIAGVWLGRWFSRLRAPCWLFGYFIPLLLLVALGLPSWFNALYFTAPFSWLTAGRTEFALGGFITTMILTTPLSRLPRESTRAVVIALMAILVLSSSILVFLGPALIRNYLLNLKTTVDTDGICLQSNNYNCGPAACVTALRGFGFKAEEGNIAVAAHTWFLSGTQPDSLASALNELYSPQGLQSEYRFFKNLAELRQAGPTIAVVKHAFLVDHYVAVLAVDDKKIVVGDPLQGKVSYSPEEFAKIWRFSGVVLRRASDARP